MQDETKAKGISDAEGVEWCWRNLRDRIAELTAKQVVAAEQITAR